MEIDYESDEMELKEYCGNDAKSYAKILLDEEDRSFEYTVEAVRGFLGITHSKAFNIVMQASLINT